MNNPITQTESKAESQVESKTEPQGEVDKADRYHISQEANGSNHSSRRQPKPSNREGMFSNFEGLPRLLRAFGGCTLLGAVIIYLFQGSQTDNEFFRYFLLLGHTVGLAILGFFCSRSMGDNKGARTLVALALASVPANFAILGGFIRSQFLHLDHLHAAIPTVLTWKSDSLTGALLATGAAFLLLAPVIYVGFLIMSRPIAKAFTALFLVGNVMILSPIRDPLFIAIMVIGLAIYMGNKIERFRVDNPHLRTFEGWIAQLILLSPLLIIVGRSLWIYGAESILTVSISALLLGFLRYMQGSTVWAIVNRIIEVSRLVVSVVFAACFAYLIAVEWSAIQSAMLPLFGLTLVALMWDLSRTLGSDLNNTIGKNVHLSQWYLNFGVWSLVILTGLNLALFETVMVATFTVITGILVLSYGVAVQGNLIKFAGVLLLGSGIVHQLMNLMDLFSLGGWGSLALLGVSAILISSLVEKHGARMQALWGRSMD